VGGIDKWLEGGGQNKEKKKGEVQKKNEVGGKGENCKNRH